ncbi:hypothetical protein FH972_026859 [Carpinus fangiana]|uniref:Uncharacterized protein n=1 Tax=Carpinus fangiana TaxID=176857 RepID=A0A5N6L5I0_9ROSI|nr:hypothetical protein FH972_026859 [Carpinus fangiana]
MDSSSFQSSGDFSYSFKIILIGDAGVGKTSLISNFVSNSFETPQSTDDVDLKIKLLTIGDTKLMLKIWDTVGQEKFRTLTQSFYRGADGIILVYDITNRSSFTAISDFWAKEVGLRTNNPDCVMMLVGNKFDMYSERDVSQEEGIELAKGLECSFFESSIEFKESVKQCFVTLALQIMEVYGIEEEEEEEEEEESPGVNMGIQVNMDVGSGGGGSGRRGGRGRGSGRGRGRGSGRSRGRGLGRGRVGRRGIRGGRVIRSVPRVLRGRC